MYQFNLVLDKNCHKHLVTKWVVRNWSLSKGVFSTSWPIPASRINDLRDDVQYRAPVKFSDAMFSMMVSRWLITWVVWMCFIPNPINFARQILMPCETSNKVLMRVIIGYLQETWYMIAQYSLHDSARSGYTMLSRWWGGMRAKTPALTVCLPSFANP